VFEGIDLGEKMKRCTVCVMLEPICICPHFEKIETKARLILLMHRREFKKTTNSGRLAILSLTNQEMHIIGHAEQPMDWKSLWKPGFENLFLFPSPDAEVLDEEYVSKLDKPVRLIVVDGNWGQANRMSRRLNKSGNFKSVTLPLGAPSEYRLRTAPEKVEGVSTLEAIARTFGILESNSVEDRLMKIFRLMVERNLFARGQMSREDVIGGIPKWP